MWTDTDHYRAVQQIEDDYRAEIDRLHDEIAEWRSLYIEAIRRSASHTTTPAHP
ncbi:MAG TPA: hypothetical protein VMX12_00160 [Acidimicrobiia bacterium]|nr:hypothetical protein [Acidimicrobiia bacterium]